MNAMLGRLECPPTASASLWPTSLTNCATPWPRCGHSSKWPSRTPADNTAALLRGSIDEVDRLSQLVDELLTLARLDEGVLSLHLGYVDLDDLALLHADRLTGKRQGRGFRGRSGRRPGARVTRPT